MIKQIAPLALVFMWTYGPAALAGDLQADLMDKEKSLWTAWAKKDADTYGKHITANYVSISVGDLPISGREAYVKYVASHHCELRKVSYEDVSLQKLTADVVVLGYRVTQDNVCDGKPLPPKLVITSIWQQQNGQWLNASYHESPVN